MLVILASLFLSSCTEKKESRKISIPGHGPHTIEANNRLSRALKKAETITKTYLTSSDLFVNTKYNLLKTPYSSSKEVFLAQVEAGEFGKGRTPFELEIREELKFSNLTLPKSTVVTGQLVIVNKKVVRTIVTAFATPTGSIKFDNFNCSPIEKYGEKIRVTRDSIKKDQYLVIKECKTKEAFQFEGISFSSGTYVFFNIELSNEGKHVPREFQTVKETFFKGKSYPPQTTFCYTHESLYPAIGDNDYCPRD